MVNGNCYAERSDRHGELTALSPAGGERHLAVPQRRRRSDVQDRGSRQDGGAATRQGIPRARFRVRWRRGSVRHQLRNADESGTALAAEKSAGKLFSNGMQISGLLKSPTILTPENRVQMREMLKLYQNSDNAWKVMVLEAGLDFQALTLNPEDAQMLETRRFAVEDICRWFGVPPIVIGHAGDGQTMWGTGVEAILLAWMNLGLNPILRRIEARIRKDLIEPVSRIKRYAEFNREGILQMDSKAKAEFLTKLVSNGIMSRNEAREKLNMARREGADDLTAQTAMAPLTDLGEPET